MKRTKHVIGVALIAILLFNVTTSRASADIMMGSYNTGNITYAFAGSYSTAYQDQLASYMKQWDTATSKITMTKAATYSAAKLKLIYKLEAPPQSDLLGQTFVYSSNGTRLLTSGGTWYQAKCTVYNTGVPETAMRATLVHEVGHALSMAHCFGTPGHGSQNHIMHQGIKKYTAVSTYEKNELIKKWGK